MISSVDLAKLKRIADGRDVDDAEKHTADDCLVSTALAVLSMEDRLSRMEAFLDKKFPSSPGGFGSSLEDR